MIISKIRKLLGIESDDERLQRLIKVNESISDLSKLIDEVAEEFTVKNENFKQLLNSSTINDEIKKSVKVRYDNFLEHQKEDLQNLVRERNSLREQHKELIKDEKLFKAISDLSFYDGIKKKFKEGEVSLSTFDLLITAKQGKVKYADNIVLNEKGQLLILQRTRVEDDKNGGKWCLPGGHVDAGEEFEEAAIRELKEESGICVDEVEEIGVYEDDKAEIHYFKSSITEFEAITLLQNGETESSKWIDLKDIDLYPMPFNMAENIIKILCPHQPEVIKIEKAIKEGILSKEIGEELIEKARAGIYANTPENRKLGRVGQKYGETKQEEKKEDVNTNKDEKESQDEIADNYRNIVKELVKEIDPDKNYTPTVSQTEHGTSVYIQNLGHGKIRFSDHTVLNPVRMSEEIHYKLSDLTDSEKRKEIKEDIEKVLFPDRFKKHEVSVLGGQKVTLPPTKENIEDVSVKYWEDKVKNEKPIEVPENKVWNDDEVVGERVSNSGNKLVMVKRTYKNVYRQFVGKNGEAITQPKQVESESEKKEFYGSGKKEIKLSVDDKIEKAYSNRTISEDIFEKARTGKYSDNAENKRLKRVGQSYGSKKGEDTKEEKEGKKEPETDKKQSEEKTIEEHARSASESALQNAAKGGDEEHRKAAKVELDRREKEESPKDEVNDMSKETSPIDELNEKIEGELNNQENPLNEINEKIEKEVNSKEEKAPKDHVTYKTPIGQKITRSDGKKFEKVAHTGDISKDWKEIKEETKKEEPKKEEKKEGKAKNYQTFTGNVQETVDFYKKDVEKTGEEMLKLVSGKSTTISDSAINTLSILGAVTTPLDMINLFRDKEFQKKILGDLTEATFQEKEEGKSKVDVSDFSKQDKESPYMSADITTPETKGHVSIKEMGDKTATIADIQIGYEGKEGRGKGYGTDAYIEIGKKLAEKGITLESTNWEKHGTAISPQALKVWEKLEKQGYAKKIGEKVGKVLNRESGEEESKKVPLYFFVSKGNDIEKSEQEDIFEKARSGTYSDTPENRKLGRVGQKYGSKKEEEAKPSESETIDSLKEEYKTALEGNDFDKLAEIHKKLTEKSKNEEKNYSSLIDGLTKDFKKVMQESMSDDFSDESKTMELSRKTKELSRYLQIASGFSEERTEKDRKTLSSYFNLSEDKIKDIFGDGDILGLQIKEEGDILKVVSVTEDCFVKRYFNKKDNSVKMEELFLNPSLKKGEGVGINIFSNQITKYKELGFDELKVMAASGENLNGGYTWARVGYDFDKSSDTYVDDYHQFTEILKTSENKEIKKSKNLQELLSTDEGVKFWKKNHFTFSGSFDLKDSSKNMEVYNAYIDEKRNR